MTTTARPDSQPGTKGGIVHWAARYDLLIWLMTLGRERRFRERLLRPAHLQPGESVLDVGCGTGTLAIAARRQVGSTGSVTGVDPSPEMLARASRKAEKAGLEIEFTPGVAESLPFSDGRFDVVLSTVMLHHLSGKVRPQAVSEMRRVLKPGGRLLAVDFSHGAKARRGLLAHLHRHARIQFPDLIGLVSDAGFRITASGLAGGWNLQFVLAQAPLAP